MDIQKYFKQTKEKKLDQQNTRDLRNLKNYLVLKQNLGENWFFDVFVLDNLEGTEWKEVDLGFSASSFQISNDSADVVLFSWEGKNSIYRIFSLPTERFCRCRIVQLGGKKFDRWNFESWGDASF